MPKKIILLASFFLLTHLPPALTQEKKAAEILPKIKDSFALLSDGRNFSFGLYLAGARSKQFIYLLALNQLAVGLEVKVRFTALDGKTKEYEAERLRADDNLGVALYRIKTSTKDLIPITKHPDLRRAQSTPLWTLGNAQSLQDLQRASLVAFQDDDKAFTVSGLAAGTLAGMPVFDGEGKVLGLIARQNADGTHHAIVISELLQFAAHTFAAEKLDLFPTWNEVFPSQYAIEKVRASTATLETGKPGAGFFIGRDKQNAGYFLTAHHVIEGESEFSVEIAGYEESGIIGQPLPGSQDATLDLAIVVVAENCPPVKPVFFWSAKDFQKLKKGFADSTEAIASVGRSQQVGDYFQSKTGYIRGENLEGQFIQTDLSLESGDSGGPLFNKNGEVVGLNLKTELQAGSFSTANNVETVLKYLGEKLGKIEFKEKWQFLEVPSYWAKNKNWLLPAGATALTATGAILYNALKPPPALAEVPALPSGQ
ncbi:MAG: serine protease [candidate division KSB1 bacterium]|nr:serine protease [candidate division KSB1 bacterium]MDZ7276656.1 serine protease [candidate division KSB1 bacterium]MDZ7288266.1 serine protease [candidate division KSB1 bacterium]MDZ7300472.1 serine protease [candidate division KSB1 bacterium]MDZ7306821.1 serine protease [candidate division KSB1 bacterium]